MKLLCVLIVSVLQSSILSLLNVIKQFVLRSDDSYIIPSEMKKIRLSYAYNIHMSKLLLIREMLPEHDERETAIPLVSIRLELKGLSKYQIA